MALFEKRPVLPRNSGLTSAPGEENTRESIAILKTVAVIVLLFLVLLLPTQVAWMLFDFKNISSDELWFAADILTRLHSCLNPVVYGVMNKQYRRSYVAFLSRMFCCGRSASFDLTPPQNISSRERSRQILEDTRNRMESRVIEEHL
ncbi:hypothetical protein OS493_003174 [Desmophyllum pertusum]|uniref:G-protein coupled receptors family 1 profile domain-containing protein n=1 Tax=Desmophyllum pertusum TaxID=174260 RepID=A0A9W9YGR9_9CNID|nr:hypothetical protein OS493_003174 [Desmophyllum pertusum]